MSDSVNVDESNEGVVNNEDVKVNEDVSRRVSEPRLSPRERVGGFVGGLYVREDEERAERERKKQEEYLYNKMTQLKERECVYSSLNSDRVLSKWLQYVRSCKLCELKECIEVESQGHDRLFSQRVSDLSVVEGELSVLEGQYRVCVEEHLGHVRELLCVHSGNVERVSASFFSSVESGIVSHEGCLSELERVHFVRLSELKRITKEMMRRERLLLHDVENDFGVKSKAVKQKYQKMTQVMKQEMERVIGEKTKEYRVEESETGKQIQKSFYEYKREREENRKKANLIRDDSILVKHLEEEISFWKAKWLNNLREYDRRNTKLNTEIALLRTHFTRVKRRMKAFRQHHANRLNRLVQDAAHTTQTLDQHAQKAHKIIAAAKLLKNYDQRKQQQEEQEEQQRTNEKNNNNKTNTWNGNIQKTKKFMQKYNTLLLQTEALRQQKNNALKKREKLKKRLTKYIQGISLNEKVLKKKDNPLLQLQKIQIKTKNKRIRI